MRPPEPADGLFCMGDELRSRRIGAEAHLAVLDRILDDHVAGRSPLSTAVFVTHNMFEYGMREDIVARHSLAMIERLQVGAQSRGLQVVPASLQRVRREHEKLCGTTRMEPAAPSSALT